MSAVWTFQNFMGNGLLAVFYLAVIVYLFFEEKRKPYRILFVYTPALLLVCYFNPLFFRLFIRAVGEEIYYRIMWLLPMSIELSFGVVTIASKLQGIKRRFFVGICAILIMAGGSYVYGNHFYEKAENIYHMPQTVVDICDDVHVEGREIMVAMPMEFVNYVRQYDATICLPYGRNADINYDELGFLLEQDVLDAEQIVTLCRMRGCHYLVFAKTKEVIGDFADYEYELYQEKDGYLIYKDPMQYFGL